MKFTIRIVGPDNVFVEKEVDEASFCSSEGYFTVMPNHINFISKLVISTGYYLIDKEYKFFAIKGGFCTIDHNVCTVITSKFIELDVKNTSEMFRISSKLKNMTFDQVKGFFNTGIIND